MSHFNLKHIHLHIDGRKSEKHNAFQLIVYFQKIFHTSSAEGILCQTPHVPEIFIFLTKKASATLTPEFLQVFCHPLPPMHSVEKKNILARKWVYIK